MKASYNAFATISDFPHEGMFIQGEYSVKIEFPLQRYGAAVTMGQVVVERKLRAFAGENQQDSVGVHT